MLQLFEREIWESRFASRLTVVQPRFPIELAKEIATSAWAQLCVLHPDVAVDTLLVTAIENGQAPHDYDRGRPSASA